MVSLDWFLVQFGSIQKLKKTFQFIIYFSSKPTELKILTPIIIPVRDVYKGSRTSLTKDGGTGKNSNRSKAHDTYLKHNTIKKNKNTTGT
jgi:hypothetical protein